MSTVWGRVFDRITTLEDEARFAEESECGEEEEDETELIQPDTATED